MMTYVEALTVAINAVSDTDVKEKLEALKIQIAKRNSGDRKPSKKQIANEGVKADILAMLTDEGKQCKEIAETLGISGQKCSALLKQLVDCGLADKYTEKRVTFFRLADAVVGA